MIDRVAELNRVVIALKNVIEEDGNADYTNVLNQCDSVVIEGRLPNHKVSIGFAQDVGLIQKKGSRLILTKNGESFSEFNPNNFYDLSSDQKKLLILTCYLHGTFRLQSFELIKRFSPDYRKKTFSFPIADTNLIMDKSWLIEHLVELDLLLRDKTNLYINPKYVDAIASFRSKGKGWSEESWIEYWKERKEIGDIAEGLVLSFEKSRLTKLGCKVEAVSVRNISKLMVDAGYDIESFNRKTSTLDYDRFIEVKGAKDPKVKFFWSDNEIKKAKKMGQKYWIYFQGGIDAKTGITKNEPLLFQNPIKNILKNPNFKKTPQGVIVEGDLKGKLIKS